MPVQRQIGFWLAALVVAALTLYLLREVLLPFVAGMALAYVLDPVVDRLERLGLGRLGASILILALFILTFVLALVVLFPLVAHQLAGFGANLPAYVERIQALIAEQSGPLIDKLGGAEALPDMQQWIGGLVRQGAAWMAGFIRGQAAVCLVLGTFYAVGLSLIGLNFGALIGMSAGVLSFIPYVGSLTGLVLSVGVAVVQFWPDWTWIGATLGIFITGQFIEGNILSPKLVGASVGLHPVWLMFALFAFGALLGFVGLLLAVPLAAIAGVLGRFALRRYLASTVYHGRPNLPPEP